MPALAAKPQIKSRRVVRIRPGERQGDFVLRYHRAMQQDMPRLDQRNSAALREWREQGQEAELQSIVSERFSPDEFLTVHDRPVFCEHVTKRNGRAEKYDRQALEAIADRCNRRILDTGDFAVLSAGHTPEESGLPQPDVLGYCGPFRVGLIGNKEPRWAIFCDEHIYRTEADRARKLARRSPEVWIEDRMSDRILDPIAALGSETPRLDLGVSRFCRLVDGRVVEKYSAAAAFPSGGNTAMPTTEFYSEGERPMPGEMRLSDEMINRIAEQVMNLFMESKYGQGLVQMVDSGSALGGSDQGQPADLSEDEGDSLGDLATPDANPNQTEMSLPAANAAPPAAMPATSPAPANDGMDDDERAKYSALPEEQKPGWMAARSHFRAKKDNYSRASSVKEVEALKQQNQKLQQSLQQANDAIRETTRYSRLSSLNQDFTFDLDEELELTKDLTDPQFERHAEVIASRYSRRPTHIPEFPTPEFAPPLQEQQVSFEKYARKTRDHIDQCIREGKPVPPWREAFELVSKKG